MPLVRVPGQPFGALVDHADGRRGRLCLGRGSPADRSRLIRSVFVRIILPGSKRIQVIALVAIALILGTSLCLFDQEDLSGGDLCFSIFTTAVGLPMVFSSVPAGYLLTARGNPYHSYSRDLPTPPPKA
jgi:hypothetical protein